MPIHIAFDAQRSGIFLSSLLRQSVQLLVLVVPSLKLSCGLWWLWKWEHLCTRLHKNIGHVTWDLGMLASAKYCIKLLHLLESHTFKMCIVTSNILLYVVWVLPSFFALNLAMECREIKQMCKMARGTHCPFSHELIWDRSIKGSLAFWSWVVGNLWEKQRLWKLEGHVDI